MTTNKDRLQAVNNTGMLFSNDAQRISIPKADSLTFPKTGGGIPTNTRNTVNVNNGIFNNWEVEYYDAVNPYESFDKYRVVIERDIPDDVDDIQDELKVTELLIYLDVEISIVYNNGTALANLLGIYKLNYSEFYSEFITSHLSLGYNVANDNTQMLLTGSCQLSTNISANTGKSYLVGDINNNNELYVTFNNLDLIYSLTRIPLLQGASGNNFDDEITINVNTIDVVGGR